MPPLKEKELQELVEGKRQKPGDLWELVCSVDAEGISPMSLAIESGNAQWMAAYINKDALSYLSSCHAGEQNWLSYQTRCKYLISASSAIAKLLSIQELGRLSDPLSDLLKLFVLPVEKNPYKSNGQPVLNRAMQPSSCTRSSLKPFGGHKALRNPNCPRMLDTRSNWQQIFLSCRKFFRATFWHSCASRISPRIPWPYSRALQSWPQHNSSGKHGNGITTVNALCTLFSNFCTCGSQCRALML